MMPRMGEVSGIRTSALCWASKLGKKKQFLLIPLASFLYLVLFLLTGSRLGYVPGLKGSSRLPMCHIVVPCIPQTCPYSSDLKVLCFGSGPGQLSPSQVLEPSMVLSSQDPPTPSNSLLPGAPKSHPKASFIS
jgi:hypothetical protein